MGRRRLERKVLMSDCLICIGVHLFTFKRFSLKVTAKWGTELRKHYHLRTNMQRKAGYFFYYFFSPHHAHPLSVPTSKSNKNEVQFCLIVLCKFSLKKLYI